MHLPRPQRPRRAEVAADPDDAVGQPDPQARAIVADPEAEDLVVGGAQAQAAGVLQRAPGGATPYQYTGFVGGSGPAGFTIEPLSQFDFTAPATEGF
ncbi:MAG: hypothetical protein ACR2NB_15285, partial [Solirubrobacteraceae bacterium]